MKRPDDIIYNVPLCLAFEKIDTARLTEAVKKTVAAHPYINTHIEAKDGELVQVRNDSHIPEVGYREIAEQDFASYKAGFYGHPTCSPARCIILRSSKRRRERIS